MLLFVSRTARSASALIQQLGQPLLGEAAPLGLGARRLTKSGSFAKSSRRPASTVTRTTSSGAGSSSAVSSGGRSHTLTSFNTTFGMSLIFPVARTHEPG